MGKIEFKPLEINENVKIDLNVKLDPDSKNQALTELMSRALTEYFEGGKNTTNINMVLDQLNKLKTGNGLIPGGAGGMYTASAPGKPE
jgi:DNA-directed RNA polymerase subunit E'/Rpb7